MCTAATLLSTLCLGLEDLQSPGQGLRAVATAHSSTVKSLQCPQTQALDCSSEARLLEGSLASHIKHHSSLAVCWD